MGFEMADVGLRMVEESINQLHPDWSEAERKAAVFERIYRSEDRRIDRRGAGFGYG